ncbi:MAG: hydantoinase B/oxoprolinase family protein [Enterocloster bolteae]
MKKSDPIVMEVINNRLQSIANEMEDSLLKMAFSVIVKEMKDASTAIFDAKGRTIAQPSGYAVPIRISFLVSTGYS